jgi:drug/metabolite transporter (DMT)-like permease
MTWYYILIILSAVCFSAQFAFTKRYESATEQTPVTSLLMLIATSVFGAMLFLLVGGFRVQCNLRSLFWATFMAGLMIPYYMLGIKVLSLGSLAVYGIFMMLGGLLVPFFYGLVFLREAVSWGKIAGTLVLTACIILQAYTQTNGKKEEKKSTKLFLLLCLCIFFINGMTGVVSKAHQIHPTAIDEVSFTVLYCALTALFSAIFLAVQLCIGKKLEKRAQAKSVLLPKTIGIMALLGFATHTGNFLILKASPFVPASVQFPIISGGTIVLSALVSAFIYKEKVSKNEWLCVAGAFLATFLFAF